MSSITVTINTNGAAFRQENGTLDRDEVTRALTNVAETIEAGRFSGRLMDTNGNGVIEFTVEEDPRFEYEVQGNYGDGYECVTTETEKSEAEDRLAEYRENEPGIPFRVRRVRAEG